MGIALDGIMQPSPARERLVERDVRVDGEPRIDQEALVGLGRRGEARRQVEGLTIGSALDDRANNFNLIRVIAASVVLLSHCYPLTGFPEREPFQHYLGGYDTGGGWAVSVFFVISGFLVTKSVLQHPPSDYIAARFLRIVPALAFVSLFQILLVGPLFTRLPLAAYFSAPSTWATLLNITVFDIQLNSPELFQDNPVAGGVNGSLWTLPIETGFYALLLLASLPGLLSRRALPLLTLAVALVFIVQYHVAGLSWQNEGGVLYANAPLFTTTKYGVLFLSGATYYVLRDRIPCNGGIALLMLILLYIFAYSRIAYLIIFITTPYLVLYLASLQTPLLQLYRRFGDYSYGIYIFAFPVQQAVVAWHDGRMHPPHLFFIAFPITLVLAMASWRFVERPALKLRRRPREERQQPPAPKRPA